MANLNTCTIEPNIYGNKQVFLLLMGVWTLVQITSEALKNNIMTSNIWISMAFPFQHELCALSANEKWSLDENVGKHGVWSQWIFMKHLHTHKEIILWCKWVKHKNKKGGKHFKEGPNQHAATAVIYATPAARCFPKRRFISDGSAESNYVF